MTGNLLTNGNGISRIMESATLRRIRFGLYTGDEQAVLMRFVDPAPCEAVCASMQIDGPPAESQTNNRDCIDIITVPSSPKDDPTLRMRWINWAADPARADCSPALTVKLHGVEVVWRPGRAVVFAQTEQMEPIVAAVVEFAYYHNELRKLECEIADSWQELEIDKRLAYEVRKIDLRVMTASAGEWTTPCSAVFAMSGLSRICTAPRRTCRRLRENWESSFGNRPG